VYVTHDQDEAMSLSDRIVVMNSGRIEQAATPAEIYRHPASVFVADFIGRANFLRLDHVRAVGQEAEVSVLGKTFLVGCAPGALEAEKKVLLVRPESMRVQPSTEKSISGNVGRVISSVFYGESVEYEVESEQGSLTCVAFDPDPNAIHHAGDYVALDFEQDRTWLLSAAGHGAYAE
jgi:iron(III) transport system ATP-binding protein